MSTVTVEDIQKIFEGGPIRIDVPYPLTDNPSEFEWYMAQPDDWLYDMAQAVREAAVAEAHSLPEIQRVASLPPTESFISKQAYSKRINTDRLAALDAKGEAILPEEDLERANIKEYLSRLIDPQNYTRSDEIVGERARKALESWLMPRLVQDKAGKPMFNMSTAEGQRKWMQLGRDTKEDIKQYFYQAFMLIQTAKNYKSGQSSS